MKKMFFALSTLLLATAPTIGFAAATYEQVATLESTTVGFTPFGDSYGMNIYAKDDYLFVDAPTASTSGKDAEGAVYVYKKSGNNWTNTQIITPNGMSNHYGAFKIVKFGNLLLIAGIDMPIGPSNEPANFSGSIQIYQLNSPTGQFVFLQALDRTTPGLENLTFVDPTGNVPPQIKEQGAGFGLSFDIDDYRKILLVGAATQANIDNNLQPLVNVGTVFSFKYDQGVFTLLESFTNPDGLFANDGFGGCIRINGEYALISNSAFFSEAHLGDSSTVYLYKFEDSHWNLIQRLQGDQIGGTLLDSPFVYGGPIVIADNFGASIAFNGDWAVIGAPYENLGSNTLKGAAYFFKFKTVNKKKRLEFKQKVVSSDPNALFTGISVGLDGTLASIADPLREGPAGARQGGALAYQYSNGIWNNEAVLYDSAGVSYQMLSTGVDVRENLFFVGTGTSVPTIVLRIFFVPALDPLAPIPVVGPGKVAIFKRKT
jgi:hypothetical protein